MYFQSLDHSKVSNHMELAFFYGMIFIILARLYYALFDQLIINDFHEQI